MKLYFQSRFCPQARRDYFREKDETLTRIWQTRKPNESLSWAPFWTANTLLAAWPPCSCRVRVNLYGCAVNTDYFGSDIYYIFVLKSFKNTINRSIFWPTIKSDVYRMPIAELLWQCPPLAAVFNYVQHCTRNHNLISLIFCVALALNALSSQIAFLLFSFFYFTIFLFACQALYVNRL